MKKIAVSVAGAMLAISLVVVLLHLGGIVSSQTSQPGTAVPASSATPAAGTTTSYANRPLGRWITSNMMWLNTLIFDTDRAIGYLEDMNLAYAEETFPQIRCDIATMRGVSPPNYAPRANIWGDPPWVETTRPDQRRDLWAAPSGYKCPPIPDAQAAADLELACVQLEAAINSIVTGLNTANGDLIQAGTAAFPQARATLATVVTDITNANK